MTNTCSSVDTSYSGGKMCSPTIQPSTDNGWLTVNCRPCGSPLVDSVCGRATVARLGGSGAALVVRVRPHGPPSSTGSCRCWGLHAGALICRGRWPGWSTWLCENACVQLLCITVKPILIIGNLILLILWVWQSMNLRSQRNISAV